MALARALAPHPRVMLMDEPFSGLDVGLRGDIRDNTLALLKESGTATLFVTHDPEEAMLSADRIVLMRGGRLVQVGRPVDLYRHPVDPFAAGFFGRVNRFTGVVRAGQVATVLGPVSTRLPEGSAAQVLVRHEAVKLVPAAAPDAAAPRLRDLRTLGRATLLTLDCPDGTVVHARIPGTVELPPGGPVALTVDVERAYVFPADG